MRGGAALQRSLKTRFLSYWFILPSFVFVALFLYYPVYTAFYHSFTRWNLASSEWIGWDNYVRLFQDGIFLTSMRNQFILTITDLVKQIVFPLLAAELIHMLRSKRWKYIYRSSFILPMLVPGIVTVLLWKYIYNPQFGALNQTLKNIGLEEWAKPWLGDSTTAIWSIVAMGFPFVGGLFFLIFYAAIASFDKEMLEAAKIDGATGFDIFRTIHIPLLIPHIRTISILTVIGSLQDYTKVLVLTQGGPGAATMTPALTMYNVAFSGSEYGYGSAIGTFLFIMILTLTVLNMTVFRSRT